MAKIRKLRGKGALYKCPKCGDGGISAYDRDEVSENDMIQKVECENCGAMFIETWKAVSWEED